MYFAGFYRNKKTRLIDIFNTVLIARVPFYFLTLFNVTNALSVDANLPIDEITEFAMSNLLLLIPMTVFMILIVVWMLALLYNGYKIATNAKGNNSIILFIVALFAAEIISKLIIYKTIL